MAAPEKQLRGAGFAVALSRWKDLETTPEGWTALAAALDQGVEVFVFAGEAPAFSADILAKISLLLLTSPLPPVIALALTGPGEISAMADRPLLAGLAQVIKAGEPLGARMAAARVRKKSPPTLPFHLRVHCSPYSGLWLELAPEGESTPDFMAGVLEVDIPAFGIGPRGGLPERCTLSYPLRGIRGEVRGRPFTACAARDTLDVVTACYLKLGGIPSGILLGRYPDAATDSDMAILAL